ncbi:MAG: helix-turn-helix domain-containing protein [Candidatus Bathyarchaeia archaeon]
MYLPCESIGQRLLPVFRSYIAKELIEKYGLTQTEVAKKLGTTQAAISQYLRLKRGVKSLEEFWEILPMIQLTASEVANEIASGRISSDKIASRFCKLCLFAQRKASGNK